MDAVKDFKLVEEVKNFMQEEDGVTAIEYGLIAALIAVAIILAVTQVGTSLEAIFYTISDALGGAGAPV
jgi:pilus assembly protein Flp/PilA